MKEKIYGFVKKNLKWILLFILIILFIEVTIRVYGTDVMKRDVIGYKLISNLISDKITPVTIIITQFGSALLLIILTVVLAIIIKDKKISFSIFLNLILVGLINQILKHIVQRPRPTEYRIIDEKGYSFPSGHSMASVAFYGFLIYLIYKNIKNKYLKYILIALLFALIMSIGISRIYLGVHYPSDVIAGFLVAISYLIMFIHIVGKNCGEPS